MQIVHPDISRFEICYRQEKLSSGGRRRLRFRQTVRRLDSVRLIDRLHDPHLDGCGCPDPSPRAA